MPTELNDLDVYKLTIVRELFVDTADDNYLIARWCYAQFLLLDFQWLSLHALEKYLKAALLMNGVSAKKYRHDIGKLFSKVEGFAKELLPERLEKPDRVNDDGWQVETPKEFVARLFRFGNSDNRYFIYGYNQFREDLYKLDRMVFSVRRLCDRPLETYYVPRHARRSLGDSHPLASVTVREFLLSHPDHWEQVAGGKLADAVNGSRGESIKRVVLNHNLPFVPANYEHGEMRTPSAVHVPVLWRHVLEPLSNGGDKTIARQLGQWAINNIQLPKDVVDQIEDAFKLP